MNEACFSRVPIELWKPDRSLKVMAVSSDGHLVPQIDNTYDLGSNSYRVHNIYAATIYGSLGDAIDHGTLTGLDDDDHPQYILHSIATAANDFLVASGAGAYVKKTLAETRALLGIAYQMEAGATASNPLDSTTYYLGYHDRAPSTTESWRKYFLRSGKVRAVRVSFWQSAGSGETSSIYFRINGASDTLISAMVTNNASATTFLNNSLDIPVSAGDYFTIKWVTPAWVTNPTGVEVHVDLLIEPPA
jgi:hypothetical protein